MSSEWLQSSRQQILASLLWHDKNSSWWWGGPRRERWRTRWLSFRSLPSSRTWRTSSYRSCSTSLTNASFPKALSCSSKTSPSMESTWLVMVKSSTLPDRKYSIPHSTTAAGYTPKSYRTRQTPRLSGRSLLSSPSMRLQDSRNSWEQSFSRTTIEERSKSPCLLTGVECQADRLHQTAWPVETTPVKSSRFLQQCTS